MCGASGAAAGAAAAVSGAVQCLVVGGWVGGCGCAAGCGVCVWRSAVGRRVHMRLVVRQASGRAGAGGGSAVSSGALTRSCSRVLACPDEAHAATLGARASAPYVYVQVLCAAEVPHSRRCRSYCCHAVVPCFAGLLLMCASATPHSAVAWRLLVVVVPAAIKLPPSRHRHRRPRWLGLCAALAQRLWHCGGGRPPRCSRRCRCRWCTCRRQAAAGDAGDAQAAQVHICSGRCVGIAGLQSVAKRLRGCSRPPCEHRPRDWGSGQTVTRWCMLWREGRLNRLAPATSAPPRP